jgi:hypothetical protein
MKKHGGDNFFKPTLFAVVGLTLLLGACTPTAKIDPRIDKPRLPAIPAEITACWPTVEIPAKDMSSDELVSLLAKVRKSEVYKSKCGRRFEAWYGSVRKNYGKV